MSNVFCMLLGTNTGIFSHAINRQSCISDTYCVRVSVTTKVLSTQIYMKPSLKKICDSSHSSVFIFIPLLSQGLVDRYLGNCNKVTTFLPSKLSIAHFFHDLPLRLFIHYSTISYVCLFFNLQSVKKLPLRRPQSFTRK